MVGDIEHHAVGPVKLGLVERGYAWWPPCKASGAELFELVGEGINVVDQDAEVMDAAEIEARALIPAEPKDRQVDGSIAQEDSVGGALTLGLSAAHFHEIKRLLVELGRGVRVFRRDGDVTKLRHCCLLPPALQRGEGNHSISAPREAAEAS